MQFWRKFWDDQSGAVVSAELIAVSTVGVLSSTAGLNMMATSVNGEFREMSHAVRSLNQSYSVAGFSSCRAWTAGSCYLQPDSRKSIADLDAAFVGDLALPPAKVKPEAGGGSVRKNGREDDAAFVVPDESSLGEADPVASDDDASKVETTVEPVVEL